MAGMDVVFKAPCPGPTFRSFLPFDATLETGDIRALVTESVISDPFTPTSARRNGRGPLSSDTKIVFLGELSGSGWTSDKGNPCGFTSSVTQ